MNICALFLLFLQQDEIVTKDDKKITGTVKSLVIETKYLGEVKLAGDKIYYVHLAKHNPIDKKKVADLVKKLGDAEASIRDQATKDLINCGVRIIPLIKEQLKSSDEEVRSRVGEIIKTVEGETDTVFGEGYDLKGLVKSVILDDKEHDILETKEVYINRDGKTMRGMAFSFSDGSRVLGKIKDEKIAIETEDDVLEIDARKIGSMAKTGDVCTIQTSIATFKGVLKGGINITTNVGDLKISDGFQSFSSSSVRPFFISKIWVVSFETQHGKTDISLRFGVTLTIKADRGGLSGEIKDQNNKFSWKFKASFKENQMKADIDPGDFFKELGMNDAKVSMVMEPDKHRGERDMRGKIEVTYKTSKGVEKILEMSGFMMDRDR